ncbi:hypothetical protein NQ318_014720 [Aromia moschata]|uniref:Integrase zinc-binding domain-containing protein n=1 Tax=Aromia moschata TaxID=1265417 RepID=A0AAV8ZBA5_9CUCU|nr:hypothetical protein NQ318_014720 [Aromia moschata]
MTEINNLEKLIRKRAVAKGNLTRFKNFLDNLDANNPDLLELEVRLKKLDLCWQAFCDIQLEIDILDDNPNDHEQERQTFENDYFKYEAMARRLLNPQVGSIVGESGANSNSLVNEKFNIKLPTINLPVFDGSYENWLYFKDTFNSIVHANKAISDVQKFHYLRSCLKGEATDLIKSLGAWQLINDRYENKNLLVNNHVKALFNLPAVSKESHVFLRSLLDKLNNHLRVLRVLEQPVDKWDVLIIYMVTNKLDNITLINVFDKYGVMHNCRALLDSASESHFCTAELADKLGMVKIPINISVSGINKCTSQLSHSTNINIQSKFNNFKTSVTCLIVPQITGNLPAISFDSNCLNLPPDVNLADPAFNESSKIDMLLGAQLFWRLIRMGQISLGKHNPILQNTALGWVISGEIVKSKINRISTNCNFVSTNDIDNNLRKFWELEEKATTLPLSQEEQSVEDYFKATTYRGSDGKFVVRLPLKQLTDVLELNLNNCDSELRKHVTQSAVSAVKTFDIFKKYSSFTKLQRVTAYILRFKNNLLSPTNKQIGPLSPIELETALTTLVKLVQAESFSHELNNLKNKGTVDNKSKLLKLNPFIDDTGLIREKKHPLVLPEKHEFSKLLVEHTHKKLLHAGPQSVLCSLRERYWIISGRKLVRLLIHKCITCFRANPGNTLEYVMGDLPSQRVTPFRPFREREPWIWKKTLKDAASTDRFRILLRYG